MFLNFKISCNKRKSFPMIDSNIEYIEIEMIYTKPKVYFLFANYYDTDW